jgi:hypothetical protein
MVRPLTVQTFVVDEPTDTSPSPLVTTSAAKEPPTAALAGRFETTGSVGRARLKVTVVGEELTGK